MLGSILAYFVPRCTDPCASIRQDALSAVHLTLSISSKFHSGGWLFYLVGGWVMDVLKRLKNRRTCRHLFSKCCQGNVRWSTRDRTYLVIFCLKYSPIFPSCIYLLVCRRNMTNTKLLKIKMNCSNNPWQSVFIWRIFTRAKNVVFRWNAVRNEHIEYIDSLRNQLWDSNWCNNFRFVRQRFSVERRTLEVTGVTGMAILPVEPAMLHMRVTFVTSETKKRKNVQT